MNFIDEKNVACVQIRQNRREITGTLDGRSGRHTHRRAHFIARNMCQRCLSQSGRTMNQHMIERFAARPRRCDHDPQVIAQRVLADQLIQALWTQCTIERAIITRLLHTVHCTSVVVRIHRAKL